MESSSSKLSRLLLDLLRPAGSGLQKRKGLIMAAQTQSLRMNAVKANIDTTPDYPVRHMCGQKEESVSYLPSEFPNLETLNTNGGMMGLLGLSTGTYVIKMGYIVARSGVITFLRVSQKMKILKFCGALQCKQTKHLQRNSLNIVIVHTKKRECQIIDVACPGDSRLENKEDEKTEKYCDLEIESKTLWKLKLVKVVPVVLGALIRNHPQKILLGMRILRRVLGIYGGLLPPGQGQCHLQQCCRVNLLNINNNNNNNCHWSSWNSKQRISVVSKESRT